MNKFFVALLALCFSISASAITYDFTGGDGSTITEFNGIQLSAFFNPNGNSDPNVARSVLHTRNGLGVLGGRNRQIDNGGPGRETLVLNFGSYTDFISFTIRGQDFGRSDTPGDPNADRVQVRVGQPSQSNPWIKVGALDNNVEYQFAPGASGNQLRFRTNKKNVQGYFLASVTTVPDGGSSVALLGLGLIGLAFARRRLLS